MTASAKRESLFKFLESFGESAWQLNLERNELHMSVTFWKALGYDPSMLPLTREAARKLIHGTDRGLALEEIELHMRADEPFEIEVRLRTAHRQWRCVRVRGCAIVWDSKGEPSVTGGILNDITDEIHAARIRSNAAEMIATLSPREQQVLGCLVAGAANKNIAYALGLSQRTVEGYRARLMEKLGVRGTAELIEVALDGGLKRDGSAECSSRLSRKAAPPR